VLKKDKHDKEHPRPSGSRGGMLVHSVGSRLGDPHPAKASLRFWLDADTRSAVAKMIVYG